MTERNEPPPLHTALEIERLRARLDAHDARIEELSGLLRPLDAKLDRYGAPLVSALAIATLALAILLGVMSLQHIRHLAAAEDGTSALTEPATANQQRSGDDLPLLGPPAKRTRAVSGEPRQPAEPRRGLVPSDARAA